MVIEIRPPVSAPIDWTDRLAAFVGAAGAFGGYVPNCVPLNARAASWKEAYLILEEAETVANGVEPDCCPAPQPWRWGEGAGVVSYGLGVVSYGKDRSFASLSEDGRVWASAPPAARASARFRAQAGEVMARRWGHLGRCQATIQDSAKTVTLLRTYAAVQKNTEHHEFATLAGYIADYRPWLATTPNKPLIREWEMVLIASGAAEVPLIARWMRS